MGKSNKQKSDQKDQKNPKSKWNNEKINPGSTGRISSMKAQELLDHDKTIEKSQKVEKRLLNNKRSNESRSYKKFQIQMTQTRDISSSSSPSRKKWSDSPLPSNDLIIKDEVSDSSESTIKEKPRNLEKPEESSDVLDQDFIPIPDEFQHIISENQNEYLALENDQDDVPWMTPEIKLLKGHLKLHYEIISFYNVIKPTDLENLNRTRTVDGIKDLVLSKYPDWKVKCFGSFPCDIHLPDSDVDIVIISSGNLDSMSVLKSLDRLFRQSDCFVFVKMVEFAKVPVLKAVYKETQINVDISVNRKNGYEARNIIQSVIQVNPSIKYILYVIKYFLRQRSLNESYRGGISSFIIFNLVYVYFTYFNQTTAIPKENITLSHILCGFLEFFTKSFNYEEVGISIRDGGYFFRKKDRNWLDDRRRYLLCVENYQEPDTDIGKSAYNIKDVIRALKIGRDSLLYPSKAGNSYLERFIRVDACLKRRK